MDILHVRSVAKLKKKVFMEKKKLCAGKMNLELKNKNNEMLTVWSVALYAAERWTLTQTDRRKLTHQVEASGTSRGGGGGLAQPQEVLANIRLHMTHQFVFIP